MGRIEDARSRLSVAEGCLRSGDYAGALREAKACIEVSAKALLDILSIDYTIERSGRKWIPHDVSNKITEAFEKLEPYLENYEVKNVRADLARVAVLLRLLTSIRDFTDFGVKELKVGIKDIFDSSFSKDLARVLVGLVHSAHWRVYDMIQKIERKRKPILI